MINITGTVLGAMNALNAHYNKQQLKIQRDEKEANEAFRTKTLNSIQNALYDENKDINLYEEIQLMNERLMPGGGVVGEGLGKEVSDIKEMVKGGMNNQIAMMAMQNANQQAQARQQSLDVRKLVRGGRR